MNTDFSIRHFGIVIKNIDESLFFYENLLGFKGSYISKKWKSVVLRLVLF